MGQYYQSTHFSTTLNKEQVTFISKPGIENWDRVTPHISLLSEIIEIKPDDNVLLLGSGHGALAVYIARKLGAGGFWLTDLNVIALDLSKETLTINHVDNANIYRDKNQPQSKPDNFMVAIVDLPKGRQLARRTLLDGFLSLTPGGRLYLAGTNRSGIKSAIKDAEELFGNSSILGYRKGSRVASYIKRANISTFPDWAMEPGLRTGTWHKLKSEIAGHKLELFSLPGVFSYQQVDEGTSFLLQHIESLTDQRVLDLGCGYGIIGLIAALENSSRVDMIDNNMLAVASANKNVQILKLENATVIAGDGLIQVLNNEYDQILTNPPFHTGLKVDYTATQTFIRQSWDLLPTGGKLTLVSNRFIRYDQTLELVFGNVKTIAENKQFHVLSAVK